jgi:hypothetical protein
MSFPEEATHPRYYGEGYPDWPGRTSNKEGESWTSIAGLSSEWIRQSCAMPLRSQRMVVAGMFAIAAAPGPFRINDAVKKGGPDRFRHRGTGCARAARHHVVGRNAERPGGTMQL